MVRLQMREQKKSPTIQAGREINANKRKCSILKMRQIDREQKRIKE
jgi:hypothetical protein